jgi:hypothetical protein|uniref:Uncharacterized protein n=1 Tax=Picea glauca TaxID=3330 RepID=A0A117NI23_PICGL|nr:hypothetical protein ABT39_MTgene3784 [Picea glauca]QHR86066.1 hypothetical protein Q903MT_gene64 [Picea sitchensis]
MELLELDIKLGQLPLLPLLLMVLVVVLLELLTLVLLVVGLDMDLAYESKNLDLLGNK